MYVCMYVVSRSTYVFSRSTSDIPVSMCMRICACVYICVKNSALLERDDTKRAEALFGFLELNSCFQLLARLATES